MTIPFMLLVAIIFTVGLVIACIISFFADDSGYLGDVFNALIVVGVIALTICICIGMILGKYVF